MSEIWTMGEILVEIMRPKAGMQLFEAGEFIGPFPSGAPAIFIDTAARLGHTSGMIGGVGDDDFGKNVLDRLIKDGVDCRFVKKFPNRATAVAFVTYFDDGSRKFLYHIDGTPAVMNKIDNINEIKGTKFFHIMGCSLMANEEFRKNIVNTAQMFKKAGAKITFDPNIRGELLAGRKVSDVVGPVLDNCSILFPGIDELKLLSGKEKIEEGIKKMFEIKSMELIVLKKGKKGCTVYSRDKSIDISAFVIKEVDPTGAGDCFDAGFLCGLLENKSIEECGKIAAAAGALNASAFGPMEGKISSDSVKEFINKG